MSARILQNLVDGHHIYTTTILFYCRLSLAHFNIQGCW